MTLPWIVAFGALCGVVFIIGCLVVGLLRRLDFALVETQKALGVAAATLRTDGIRPGEFVGRFIAETFDGETFSRRHLMGEDTAVVFVSSSCAACKQLISDAEHALTAHPAPRVVLVARDADDAMWWGGIADITVVVDRDAAMAAAFESHRTPHVFVVDASARVLASGSPQSWSEVFELATAAEEGGDTDFHPAAVVV